MSTPGDDAPRAHSMTLRQLPPAAAPVSARDLWYGALGVLRPGRALRDFEAQLGRALGVDHVFLVSSGRAALTLILRALRRLSSRSHVIVPGYTCYSVPASVVNAGLEVVPCDLERGTLDFDFTELESLVSRLKPLCVVSTHLFGIPADVARVRAICRAAGAFVVEDAAQAFGLETEGGALGTLGDVGFYSFGRGKSITCGEGGAIVTRSPEIAAALREEYARLDCRGTFGDMKTLVEVAVMSVLLRPWLYWLPASAPFLRLGETRYETSFFIGRLPGGAAGLMHRWRHRLTHLNRARAAHAASLAPLTPFSASASGLPCLRLPLVCRSKADRDSLYAAGRRKRLGFSLMYPGAVTAIPELRGRLNGARCPVAEDLAERLLTVPVHPFVSTADRRAIARLLQPEQQCG